MKKNKIWLILGIVLALALIAGTFFVTKDQYYEKGKSDQFVIMINGLIGSALNCQPINIPLNETAGIQLVNPECYR